MLNFVSLGKSCQTTHQLTHFVENNQRTAAMIKSPFDWLICPPDSTTAWLNEDLRDFRPDELMEFRGRAYWSLFRIWFWHGFFDRNQTPPELDIEKYADQELSKLSYLRSKFETLDPTQTCFILSNTQNNLTSEVYDAHETSLYHFNENKIDKLNQALVRYFNCPVNLQIITRRDRCTDALMQKSNVHTLPLDHSEWKGNKLNWSKVLEKLVLNH